MNAPVFRSKVRQWRIRTIVALILIMMAWVAQAAQPITFYRETLDNGLKVVIVPNHRAPVVSHNLLVAAGAADDPRGASGLAHYLEHMMFKGTPRFPEGSYDTIIQGLGGVHNAYTSSDMTGYYVTIASEHLEQVMRLEADRMQNIQPSPDAFLKEREVILEERRLRTESSPTALLVEQMRRVLHPHHPYGMPIIGWMHEMQQLSPEDMRGFWRRYYTPSNMTLLLVGDVQPAQAMRLVRRYYGGWRGEKTPPRIWTQDPPARSAERVMLPDSRVRLPVWMRFYRAPTLGSSLAQPAIKPVKKPRASSYMALLYVEELLGDGETGWLYESLVRQKKLASAVSISYYPFSRGEGSLAVVIHPVEGVHRDAIEKAYEEAMMEAQKRDISEEDMQRVRAQMQAAAIFARDDLQGMASLLATLMMIGADPAWINRWEAELERVTAEDVRHWMRVVMNNDYHVTGYAVPKGNPSPSKGETL
ncbi:MAG: insulinase family protein [Alphaproteobacteria bacterium]|nr:MAG: insulinase family protein [Alphaproteobacteria bacterium]